MSKLYIIGNGFDLHHGLDTWYSSFGLYLQKHKNEIYDLLVKYVGMPLLDADDPESLYTKEWNEFEVSLAKLNAEEILDQAPDFATDLSSDDYLKDLGAFEFFVSEIRDNLTIKLLEYFKDFIRQIKYPCLIDEKQLLIDPEAFFFNFNYTSSLQYYYGVRSENIKYIHNSANDDEQLILGHVFLPETFRPEEPKPPTNVSDEVLQEWYDRMNDDYDISFELGKDSLLQYFSDSFKNSDSIISENDDYFTSLSEIDEIIIFGHSLASVDQKYFEKILSSVKSEVIWKVACRKIEEMEIKKEKLASFGINEDNILPILVESLLIKHPL